MNNIEDAAEEAEFQARLKIILAKEPRSYITPEIRKALRQHELAESRARIAREKAKWLDNVNKQR